MHTTDGLPPGPLEEEAAQVVLRAPERREPLPHWARRAVAAGIAVSIAGGGYVFSRSAFFAADEIRVIGVDRLTPARAIRESGLTHGTNVLYLDATTVEARLEEDPWVATASVERSLPGTITIRIQEREPVATIEGADGFDLVAADGSILGSTGRAGHLPWIRFPSTLPDPSPAAPALVVAALDASVRSQVRTVTVDAAGSITLELRSRTVVLVGQATQVQAKARALAAMLVWEATNRERLAAIDLRFPGAPSARTIEGARLAP